ncbi:ABC transporter substrate-binding protein [Blautia sp.]
MKKRVISLAATAVFILGALSGCGSTSSDNSTQTTKETTEETASSDASTSDGDLVTVRDAVMTGQLDQYATEVGLWQGIFEKYGIDLKTTEFVAGINTIDSVVSGTADIGMMADYAAVNRLGNTLDATDLKIFSQLSGGGTAQSGGLYVDPKYADDLESLDGSAGFMYQEGTVTYYYASKCIEYLGLDESKQNLINTDSSQTRLALIQKGSASAVYANGSEANYIEDAGWVLAATSQEIGIQTGTYFLATDNYITENKEMLAKFLQAIDESTQYINDHLDETAEYLESDLGIKADDFKANWENYSFTPGFSEEATQHLEDIEKWGFEHGSFPKDYNVRDFITTEAVDIAYPDQATAE